MRFASTGSPAASRPPPSNEGGEAGFTLLETLMALTILAIAFVGLFEAHGGGVRMAGASADYSRARILAQSLLSETVSGWEGEPASRQGRFDRFAWVIEVAPAQGAWADLTTDANWRLRHVRVTVSWDRGRMVQLDTLKFARPRRE